jgi:KaiC/GvpD/RAD55 family RecA-like ATPase
MRSALVAVALLFSAILISMPGSSAQLAGTHYIVLYAHSIAQSQILNALPPSGHNQTTAVNKIAIFNLNPVLGESLAIHGTLFFALDLKASARSSGTVFAWLAELKKTGERVPVAANVSAFVHLENKTQFVPLGIGPVDYEFQRGSALQLNILVVSSSSAIPYLVWDMSGPAGFQSTSVSIQAKDPTHITAAFFTNQPRNGTILEANSTCRCVRGVVSANLSDAIGVYRLSALVNLTAPDGTSKTIHVTGMSTYSLAYSENETLGLGFWPLTVTARDSSGNEFGQDTHILVAPFYPVLIDVVDQSNEPLGNATVRASYRNEAEWSATTNSTGWVTVLLPSTDNLTEPLNLTAAWQSVTGEPQPLTVKGITHFTYRTPLYNFGVRVILSATGITVPLPNVNLKILSGDKVVAESVTGLDGTAFFKRIPKGNYTLRAQYLQTEFETKPSVNTGINGKIVTVNVPISSVNVLYAAVLVVVIAASTGTIFARRRSKLQPHDFSYLHDLTSGGLPDACFAVIAGNSGSGKSVLTETLAAQHLRSAGCVFIANTEYPARIRENMAALGMWNSESERSGRIQFIDAYSAIGGASSSEELYVSSPTDLTDLGLKVSKGLEETGHGTDVYLDSLNSLLSALRIEYLLNFLHSIAAKVKANDGKFCVTVGTGIEKSDLVKLEEAADCVIETQLQELKKGQRKRLRVKKLRGKPYIDKWTPFQVEPGKGIVFYSRTKP